MAEHGKEPAARESLLATAKSSIDSIVAIATVVYALGYFSWAVYAWDRELDLPPALEGQYFVAGIVPALLLSLLALVVVGLARLGAKLLTPSRRSDKKWHRIFDGAGLVFMFGGALASYLTKQPGFFAAGVTIGGAALGVSWFFSPEKIDRLFARGFKWYGLFAAVILTGALMLSYATKLFPYLPAEFGGPEILCVNLDLKRSDLADATLKLLTVPAPSGRASDTVRSRAVELLSPPGRYYLVGFSGGAKSGFLKISTDLVRAIVPAESCAPSRRGGAT